MRLLRPEAGSGRLERRGLPHELLHLGDAQRRRLQGHGKRSRSQLLLKLAGAENMLILAVNVLAGNDLAVNGDLPALCISI